MHLGQQDNVFLGAAFAAGAVGAGLMIGGFVLRFGNGFGTFVTYAEKDDDFLELGRLDMIFILFTVAAGILILSFFLALLATLKKNKFLLYMYCAVIALMIIVQLVTGLLAFQYSDSVKVLADDDTLTESINKAIMEISNNNDTVNANLQQTSFWSHTQKVFNCCGVNSSADWGKYSNQQTLKQLNCFGPNYGQGCEKQIRSRIASDSQYLAVASMGVLVVEIAASFLAGYRAYSIKYDE